MDLVDQYIYAVTQKLPQRKTSFPLNLWERRFYFKTPINLYS